MPVSVSLSAGARLPLSLAGIALVAASILAQVAFHAWKQPDQDIESHVNQIIERKRAEIKRAIEQQDSTDLYADGGSLPTPIEESIEMIRSVQDDHKRLRESYDEARRLFGAATLAVFALAVVFVGYVATNTPFVASSLHALDVVVTTLLLFTVYASARGVRAINRAERIKDELTELAAQM